MPNPRKFLLLGLTALSATCTVSAASLTVQPDSGTYTDSNYPAQFYEIPETKHLASAEAIERWQAERFGLFIHWGAYSVLEGKWQGEEIPDLGEQIQRHANISGKDYIEHAVSKFNPTQFDPYAYTRLAKAAGMRYIILTSKHHDGFCLFDSEHTDYDIMDATPYGQDIVKLFADACAAEGLKFGVYYSNPDWHHGHSLTDTEFSVNERLSSGSPNFELEKKQLHELLTNYGPMFEIFFDMGKPDLEASKELAAIVRKLQPDCLSSGRVMNNQGDFLTMSDNAEPPSPIDRAWEVPCTLSTHPGHTWGYKSWVEIPPVEQEASKRIKQLGRIASRGGNYLLNIGPKPDGTIQAHQIEVLEAIGDWVSANQEAIFDTQPNPFLASPWGEATWNDSTLYLQIPNWPQNGTLVIHDLISEVDSVSPLIDLQQRYTFQQDGNTLTINLPAQAPDARLSILKLRCKGPIETREPIVTQHNAKLVLKTGNGVATNFYHGLAYHNGIRQSKLTWNLEVPHDRSYTIKLDFRTYAKSKEPNHPMVLSINGQELHFTLEPSETYTELTLGSIDLPAGLHTAILTKSTQAIQAHPKQSPEALSLRSVQLRSLTLEHE